MSAFLKFRPFDSRPSTEAIGYLSAQWRDGNMPSAIAATQLVTFAQIRSEGEQSECFIRDHDSSQT